MQSTNCLSKQSPINSYIPISMVTIIDIIHTEHNKITDNIIIFNPCFADFNLLSFNELFLKLNILNNFINTNNVHNDCVNIMSDNNA